jgi:hypothetical protein
VISEGSKIIGSTAKFPSTLIFKKAIANALTGWGIEGEVHGEILC